MAVIGTNSPVAINFLESTFSSARSVWRQFTQFLMYKRTLKELQSMSSRELADLGLDRCELNRIAHQCVYGG